MLAFKKINGFRLRCPQFLSLEVAALLEKKGSVAFDGQSSCFPFPRANQRSRSHDFPILSTIFPFRSFRSHIFYGFSSATFDELPGLTKIMGKSSEKPLELGKVSRFAPMFTQFSHAHGPPRNFVTKTMMSCGPYNSTTCR
jgi:hypothetical protein